MALVKSSFTAKKWNGTSTLAYEVLFYSHPQPPTTIHTYLKVILNLWRWVYSKKVNIKYRENELVGTFQYIQYRRRRKDNINIRRITFGVDSLHTWEFSLYLFTKETWTIEFFLEESFYCGQKQPINASNAASTHFYHLNFWLKSDSHFVLVPSFAVLDLPKPVSCICSWKKNTPYFLKVWMPHEFFFISNIFYPKRIQMENLPLEYVKTLTNRRWSLQQLNQSMISHFFVSVSIYL